MTPSDLKPSVNPPMSHDANRSAPVSVRILERQYIIGVKPAERDSLLAAAQALDARMREIRDNNRTAALDRVAVLAALNMAHELHLLRAELARQQQQFQATLGQINQRLDQAIEGSQ